jgi:hypothetical protein
MPVRSRPSADESGRQQRLPHGIHQAESDQLDEAAGIVERAQSRPVEVPLLAPMLIKFLFSHKAASSY